MALQYKIGAEQLEGYRWGMELVHNALWSNPIIAADAKEFVVFMQIFIILSD